MSDDTMDLAALAGINFDDVEEYRGGGLPDGLYLMQCTEAAWGTKETKKGDVPGAMFQFEVKQVAALADSDVDAASLVGKPHYENFLTSGDPAKSIGSMKAMMMDSGWTPPQPGMQLSDAVATFKGHQFWVRIRSRKDPNNSDVVYTNFGRKKGDIRPEAAGPQ